MISNFTTGHGFLHSAVVQLALAACITAGATGRSALRAEQQSGEVQTAPITEPRGAEGKATTPPAVKGAAAIIRQTAKCSTRLMVNADALFERGRWTLNPDAAQTLDPLVSFVAEAGKHPARIDSYARSSDSDKDDQIVAEKRGLAIRGWLSNSGYISPETPVHGFGSAAPARATSKGSRQPAYEEQVQLIFDTCK